MSKNYISGIYNYCDRWCERCIFTSRCRNYESTGKLSPEQLDIHNKAFWDNISSNFQQAIKMLHKAAEEQGIDLDKIMQETDHEAYRERQSFLDTEVKNSPLTKLCKQYQRVVLPYLKETGPQLVDTTNELVDHLHIGIIKEEEVIHSIAGIGDCIEIIQWYVYFIDAKLQRAQHGKLEGEDWEEENGYQRDSDGSAKVAFISVEKSMAAWVKLYELFPRCEDVALKALALLQQIQEQINAEFPKALQFKRPGFDD